jgi:hypothetical protein
MYADQLPPDTDQEPPKQPRTPYNRLPPHKAADDWITRQYVKGWWIFLPAVMLAFMAPFWLTPTTETLILCMVAMWATKKYIRKFFVDNWTKIRAQPENVSWEYALQLIGAHLITVGVATGWILLFIYTTYIVATQEPMPGGDSGVIQHNPSGGLVQ